MRFFAYRYPGWDLMHPEVPLRGVTIREGHNSPAELEATVDRATALQVSRVGNTGTWDAVLRKRGTIIIAWDGQDAQAFIVHELEEVTFERDTWSLVALGHGSIPQSRPWTGDRFDGIKVDPCAVAEQIWDKALTQNPTPTVEILATKSPKRIGEEERTTEFTTGDGEQVSFESGPYRLNWWTTDDLGKALADLAAETPFEWREETEFDVDSSAPPRLKIRFGYPRLESADRKNLLFELGLNVVEPGQPEGQEYVNHWVVFGNGEGSRKIRAESRLDGDERLYSPKVISEQGLTSKRAAQTVADEYRDRAERESRFVETCRVRDHDAAPTGRYGKGDIITLKGTTVWGELNQRCRITATEHRLSDNSVQLTLERVEE